MTIESVGSFLPNETLITARRDFESGSIERQSLTEIENTAIDKIIERQISCGLPYITSGELRRKHWANDFWFGLNGIACEHVDSGRVYQSIETATDIILINGKIGFNPEHPFFDDFRFMHEKVTNRAKCRQTLPSPANLLLEIYALSDGKPETLYKSTEALIADIAEAYRLTVEKLYELGCTSIQYDDTALGLMCDDNYTKRLMQGGVDFLKLQNQLIDIINASLKGLPQEIEKSIYISGGDKIVPEWEYIEYPDNIMPKALSGINADKFFLPFEQNNEYALKVLRHIPEGKTAVLGLIDAHSPFPENPATISDMVKIAIREAPSLNFALSPRTGFKLSSYSERALTDEDQWNKLAELTNI